MTLDELAREAADATPPPSSFTVSVLPKKVVVDDDELDRIGYAFLSPDGHLGAVEY